MIFTSPNGIIEKQALHFSFKTLNNEAKYESLLVGLRLTRELRVLHLQILSDSIQVVGQVRGEYEAKAPSIGKYL